MLLPLNALVPPGVSVWVCTMGECLGRRFCKLLAVAFVRTLLPLEVRRGVWSRSWPEDEEEGVVRPAGGGVAGTAEEEEEGGCLP